MKCGWFLICLLFGSLALAQESQDSTETAPPKKAFSQEGLLSNRSLMMFNDNPALAGFDRRLNVQYHYQARNLKHQDEFELGKSPFRFQTHSALVDFSFGGDQQNWGVGANYEHVKDGFFSYHKVMLSHSFRVIMRNHQLLFGIGHGFLWSNLNWDQLTFNDMIDPRFGFVYPTNEIKPASTNRSVVILGTGVRYVWKKLSFDYAYRFGPSQHYAWNGHSNDPEHYHKLKTAYHFCFDQDVVVTPEVLVENNLYHKWVVSPSISIGYKRSVFIQLIARELSFLTTLAGYQFREMIAITAGVSTFFSSANQQALGLATLDVGARIQLKTRK